MMLPSRSLNRTQAIAALLVVSMMVGVLPLQLFMAPAVADDESEG